MLAGRLGCSDAVLFDVSQDTQFKLEANGMRCACLSGDMGKEARQRVLHAFR